MPDNASSLIVLGGIMGADEDKKFPFLRTVCRWIRRLLNRISLSWHLSWWSASIQGLRWNTDREFLWRKRLHAGWRLLKKARGIFFSGMFPLHGRLFSGIMILLFRLPDPGCPPYPMSVHSRHSGSGKVFMASVSS